MIELENAHGATLKMPGQSRELRLGGADQELLGRRVMMQISVQTRILVAVEAVDFRKGILRR